MAQQGRNRKTDKSDDKAAASRASPAKSSAAPSVRASASSRAAERLKEREAERIRRRRITIAIVIGSIAAILVVLLILVNVPQEAPVLPETAARYEGLTLSRTEDGYPLLGESSARVKVSIFSSFDCPNCRSFHVDTIDALVERVRDERIALSYVPLYGYGAVPNGQGAAIAALCAADQRAFWQFHDMLFDWQGRYGNQSFANNRISAGVDTLGLDAAQQRGCVASGSAQELLTRATATVRGLLNFNGTPTVTINGVVPVDAEQVPIAGAENILAAIDREIERVSRGGAESTPEVTPEATDERAAPSLAVTTEPTAQVTPEMTPEATLAAPETTPEATARP